MNGPMDWSRREDFDPTGDDEQPILVPSPIARERAGGVSLRRQADIDRRRT